MPNTLLAQVIETGQPIMVDLLTNQAGSFLVSRVPLRDAQGRVIGALGMVLMDHPESTMQPLMAKFGRLQSDLAQAQRALAAEQTRNRRPKYTIASYIGASPAALEVKRQARRVAGTGSTVLLLGETGKIAAAVAARAELIVTGDRKHLLPAGRHQGIAIVTAREVVDRLDARLKA